MNLVEQQASYQRCLAKQHTLQDVLTGRCLVGVEGDSGRDVVRARMLGLFTCNVKGVDVFAKCEADARPLIHYLERGGTYGSVEFSRLLGYTDAEIREYAQLLAAPPAVRVAARYLQRGER
jgi:hypothetical protein